MKDVWVFSMFEMFGFCMISLIILLQDCRDGRDNHELLGLSYLSSTLFVLQKQCLENLKVKDRITTWVVSCFVNMADEQMSLKNCFVSQCHQPLYMFFYIYGMLVA